MLFHQYTGEVNTRCVNFGYIKKRGKEAPMSGPKSTNDQGLSTLPSTFKGNSFKMKAQPPVDRKDTELGSALGGDHPERGPMTRGQSIVSDRGRDPGLMGGAWSHLSSPGPRDETSPRSFSLGATSGLVAAGAWAARLEVGWRAAVLQSSCWHSSGEVRRVTSL